ncbi:DUF6206 family protein [Aliiruegeria sabulilitoris]|uniref:DUF6206 family protein n=1 Tax=Aliiruegeria sabulilitoris TaxID=1510458 RepID=UPI000A49B7BA|nr:DUF6206 family protein [Aliiruegeria sabulilitoris]
MNSEEQRLAPGSAEWLDALRAEVTDGQREPISRMGYFCAPFRPESGPFLGTVIKVYQSRAGQEILQRLAAAHDDYVAALGACGVRLPETRLCLLDCDGTTVPVIVQEALPAASMMRDQMLQADLDGALALMEAAGEVIATFWKAAAERDDRVGFHPSIRNLAVIDGQGIFFDTFPPLIGYSHDEMAEVLIRFSDKTWMRALGPLLRWKVRGIQDEWYSPPETLIGLVGSACRLRPDDQQAFLDWGREFAQRRMPDHADEILQALSEPPRLPFYWTAFRKLLGLQGEPNIRR